MKGAKHPRAWGLVDVWETRKVNLRLLILERAGGSVVRFTELVGLQGGNSYFSRIIGPKASRNLGPTVARRIENAFGLEKGWMDKDHGQAQGGGGTAPSRVSPRALEIARQIEALPEPVQDNLERMIKSIAELFAPSRRGAKRKR